VSIVGFGRPKFKGAASAPAKAAPAKAAPAKAAPAKLDPKVKAAIDLLTKNGYTVSK
jgi:hypothetical protein